MKRRPQRQKKQRQKNQRQKNQSYQSFEELVGLVRIRDKIAS